MRTPPRATPPPPAVLAARRRAERLVDAEQVRQAIDRVAVRLALELQDTNPLVLAVMHGALPFAAALLERFAFPLELGYLHASRYAAATRGGELRWHATPDYALHGRCVLLVDDVFDRGETLAALVGWAAGAGAGHVTTAVLVDKEVSGARPMAVDHAALRCPDRYLFGCGMDFRGYWRNLPAIYALPADLEDAP